MADEPANKRMRSSPPGIEEVKGTGSTGTDCCAICMRGDGDEQDGEVSILPNHNCPVCVANAWQICDVCDDNLLSRSCPFCKSDYAPRVLYAAPDLPKFPLTQEQMSDPKVIIKINFIGKLITQSNVAVWAPEHKKMHFFLPQEFTTNEDGLQSIAVTIDMEPDQIINNHKFLFTNKVWDELTRVMEGPEEEMEEVPPVAGADEQGESAPPAVEQAEGEQVVSAAAEGAAQTTATAAAEVLMQEGQGATEPVTEEVVAEGEGEGEGNQDELHEDEEEAEPERGHELLNAKDTMKAIFIGLCSPGAQLLTQLKPEEWQAIMSGI